MFQQFQVNVNGTNTNGTVIGMYPSTTYVCTIHAITKLDGPVSDPIAVTTKTGM